MNKAKLFQRFLKQGGRLTMYPDLEQQFKGIMQGKYPEDWSFDERAEINQVKSLPENKEFVDNLAYTSYSPEETFQTDALDEYTPGEDYQPGTLDEYTPETEWTPETGVNETDALDDSWMDEIEQVDVGEYIPAEGTETVDTEGTGGQIGTYTGDAVDQVPLTGYGNEEVTDQQNNTLIGADGVVGDGDENLLDAAMTEGEDITGKRGYEAALDRFKRGKYVFNKEFRNYFAEKYPEGYTEADAAAEGAVGEGATGEGAPAIDENWNQEFEDAQAEYYSDRGYTYNEATGTWEQAPGLDSRGNEVFRGDEYALYNQQGTILKEGHSVDANNRIIDEDGNFVYPDDEFYANQETFYDPSQGEYRDKSEYSSDMIVGQGGGGGGQGSGSVDNRDLSQLREGENPDDVQWDENGNIIRTEEDEDEAILGPADAPKPQKPPLLITGAKGSGMINPDAPGFNFRGGMLSKALSNLHNPEYMYSNPTTDELN